MKPSTTVSKPTKNAVDLKSVKTLSKLSCQEITLYYSSKSLIIPESFKVDTELFSSPSNREHHDTIEFIISCIKSGFLINDCDVPTWAGIQSLHSTSEVPVMQVGFLPFIPNPVTEHSTVYTAMRNFVKVADQLQQKSLPVFCDEGVFLIVVDVYLQRPDEFRSLVPFLGGFHMAKCVQHCIGKYVRGSGLEDSLLETSIFGVKIVEQFLNGTHYVRSLRGIVILAEAIETIKWRAFWQVNKKEQFASIIDSLTGLMEGLSNKDEKISKEKYLHCAGGITELFYSFNDFIENCNKTSDMCRYWDGIVKLTKILKNLIASDRDGDWEGHLQAVQDLLPIFRECDSINYLRYASWYLEKMRKLPVEFIIYNL